MELKGTKIQKISGSLNKFPCSPLDAGITGVYSPRLYTNLIDKVDKWRVETMEFSGNGSRGGKTMVDRPNVVVIVADTFRRDHLGAYGNPTIRTPHLDEFARSSVHLVVPRGCTTRVKVSFSAPRTS